MLDNAFVVYTIFDRFQFFYKNSLQNSFFGFLLMRGWLIPYSRGANPGRRQILKRRKQIQ